MPEAQVTEEIERIAELVGDGSYAALEQYIVRRIVSLKDQLSKADFTNLRDVGEMQGQIMALQSIIQHVQYCYNQVHKPDEKEDANSCRDGKTKTWKSLLRPRSQRPSVTRSST